MKNRFLLTISLLCSLLLAVSACDKKKKGGDGDPGYAAPFNRCYNGANFGWNGVNGSPQYAGAQWNYQFQSQYQYGPAPYQYVFRNGRCFDNSNREVNPELCRNIQYAYNNDPTCDWYGGMNPHFGNGPQSNICNYGDIPIYFPATGATMCMEMTYYNNFASYGMPVYYGGAVLACSPGYMGYPTGCNCNTFGGSLGWSWGGMSMGFCF